MVAHILKIVALLVVSLVYGCTALSLSYATYIAMLMLTESRYPITENYGVLCLLASLMVGVLLALTTVVISLYSGIRLLMTGTNKP